jgi:hypothetical protein
MQANTTDVLKGVTGESAVRVAGERKSHMADVLLAPHRGW